ncbi:hypothetical protein [Mycolicibacterium aichiense]|uniref:Transposase n=1 Tax=Mycolicibacterium aichiense TaxID=1799 RepID=A0AAD1HPC3_9MYCO|nr:hypothetical protein [Mycolicibacterium aichiense]MCV7019294.1 hypothetical protein [Mycolicibacterium aichiense]BBX09208.1 hypothetical protein MAIC_40110 [Mycolicibacterium aichiense]SUA13779.1 Uncharacterised protein [Mycolicibacterium aichiense]
MTATAETPTSSEAQSLLVMVERLRAKLVRERAGLARQLRELSHRVEGIDRQLDDLTVSAEWLAAIAAQPTDELSA